jgi:hypothetical protein
MRIGKIVAFGALATLGLGLASVDKAEAAYIAYLYQDGGNVVGTGSGSLDTSDLTNFGGEAATNSVNASLGYLHLDDQTDNANAFGVVTGPLSFGGGGSFVASTAGNGNAVSIQGNFNGQSVIAVPTGYASGLALGTSTITFDGTTLAALGVTDGTYTWTWGTGPDTDSFTLNIGEAPPTSTPEPASLALLGTGLAALGLNRRRRRKGA